jgi:hypothetical protein
MQQFSRRPAARRGRGYAKGLTLNAERGREVLAMFDAFQKETEVISTSSSSRS